MEWIVDPQAWIALVTLTLLEIVLGIDNIIFISVLASRLPAAERDKARIVGLGLAMITRILLLFCITWIIKLTEPFFSVLGRPFSGRDLILLFGGLFLLGKSTLEIHHQVEGGETVTKSRKVKTFASVIAQILLLDIVFSLDSVITAVGLASHIQVMVIAVIISVIVMMLSAKAIAEFVERHPTIKVLALSFLILIGVTLVGEGTGFHLPKGYVYFAMAFSFGVEVLNMRVRKKEIETLRAK